MTTAEQAAKIRQTRYTASAVVATAGPALAIALAEGGVSKWVAFVVAVGSAFTGAAGSAYAAKNTKGQRADGHFDPVSPADAIIAALPAVIDAKAQAEADIERVKAAATDALGQVPVVGPLTQQVIASIR